MKHLYVGKIEPYELYETQAQLIENNVDYGLVYFGTRTEAIALDPVRFSRSTIRNEQVQQPRQTSYGHNRYVSIRIAYDGFVVNGAVAV
jgi:hypothetical protein